MEKFTDFQEQEIMKIVKKYMNIDRVINDVCSSSKEKVHIWMESIRPELLVNFNSIYQELTIMMKEFEKKVSSIEKKTKKLVESSSLTEDVYRTRDQMKLLNKKMDALSKTLKSFAKLGEILEFEGPESNRLSPGS